MSESKIISQLILFYLTISSITSTLNQNSIENKKNTSELELKVTVGLEYAQDVLQTNFQQLSIPQIYINVENVTANNSDNIFRAYNDNTTNDRFQIATFQQKLHRLEEPQTESSQFEQDLQLQIQRLNLLNPFVIQNHNQQVQQEEPEKPKKVILYQKLQVLNEGCYNSQFMREYKFKERVQNEFQNFPSEADGKIDVQDDSLGTREFIKLEDSQLLYKGKPFYFVGMNNEWLLQRAVNNKTYVDAIMKIAREAGITVIRTPAFANPPDFKPEPYRAGHKHILQQFPGVYNETVFATLDYIVAAARRYNIRLIFYLGNYEPKLGGINVYSGWRHSFQPQSAKTNVYNFYKDDKTRILYKANMCQITSRINSITGIAYNEDPSIMAWEILNKAKCPDCSGSTYGDVLFQWFEDMARYLKRVAPYQLIGSGSEGYFGQSTPWLADSNKGPWTWCRGVDSIRINSIPEIDYATFYADWSDVDWGYRTNEPCNLRCKKDWIHQMLTTQVNTNYKLQNKPLVVSHLGVPAKIKNKHLLKIVADMGLQLMRERKSLLGFVFASGGIQGDVNWDGMTIYLDGSKPTFHRGRSPTEEEVQEMNIVNSFYSKYYRYEEEQICAKKVNEQFAAFGSDLFTNPYFESDQEIIISIIHDNALNTIQIIGKNN